MTRVAHVSTIHAASSSRILHKECRALAEAGYEVLYLVQDPPAEPVHGVHFLAVEGGTSLRGYGRRLWSAWRAARRADAALYHLHDPELIPLGLALWLRGARVVYDVHEDSPREALSLLRHRPGWARIKAGMLFTLEAAARRLFDGFACATPQIARRFPRRRTVLVQNFPVLSELAPRAPVVPYAERPERIVYVGSLSRLRGLLETVAALELLEARDVRLLLAGHLGDAELRRELEARPGWRRVEALGHLDRAGVRDVLQRARVGVALLHPRPEYRESWPVKLFEYMAAGLPVVASDFPLWREIVEGSGCGLLVDPLDPEAIAEALRWLLDRPDEAERMGARGREAVHARYAWEGQAQRLRALYRRLLPAPGSATVEVP